VPTVNDNPLLLASSLPSDIARTGQDANFTDKLQRNGKDVATTDDLTALKNAVNSTSTGLPSKMATVDADKKYETSAHASSTYATVQNTNAAVATRMPIDSGAASGNFDEMKTDGIFYLNAFDPTNATGFPTNLVGTGVTWGKLIVLQANSGMIRQILYTLTGRFAYRTWSGGPGSWSAWQQIATGDDVQAALNQAHTDMLSELTKRGYPSVIWTGTQAQYDAMGSHDANTEYRITG
ncbi:phage upper tail fiber protein, partial [Secundilactobacillus pentosiphilus]|uniref:phage upper tail fiber protein n=1 Tax=Secundilactobacillus pentosiphilus TaxID=1714682 RepID=UPI003F760DB8